MYKAEICNNLGACAMCYQRIHLILFGLLLGSGHSFADSVGIDKGTQTASLEVDQQFSVHKSNTIDGTDFGQATRFAIGLFAGKDRDLGLAVVREQSSTKFTQKDSKMAVSWTDVNLSYRLWWFSPSLHIGSCSLKAETAGVSVVDVVCLTSGAGLKAQLPIGGNGISYFDSKFISSSSERDFAGKNVKIGLRTDTELGIALRVITFADVVTGYGYRSYDLTIDGTKSAEIHTGPFLGLRLGAMF